MQFFKKLKNTYRQKNILSHCGCPAVDNRIYVQIAQLIACNDEKVVKEVKSCISDTQAYFFSHTEQYAQRCITTSDSSDTIIWLGLVDILIKSGYATELDWKEENSVFTYSLLDLKPTKLYNLKINKNLPEENDIPEWCSLVNDEWKPQEICVAYLDIGSDSYVIFPCTYDALHSLKNLSEQSGHLIDKL